MTDTDPQREKKKAILRNQVLDGNGKRMDPEIGRFFRENRRYLAMAAGMAAALVVLIFVCIRIYHSFRTYTTYQVKWSISLGNSSVQPVVFSGGVAVVGRDGVDCYDKNGEHLWSAPYEMKQPTAVTEGEYLLIYDKKGQAMVICSAQGQTGSAATTYPISRADISAGGVTAAVLENTTESYIAYYRSSGEKLEIEIKSPLATNGYPRAISISPNGQQLAVSYTTIGGTKSYSRVCFYDFEKGKELPDRIVGEFSYDDTETYIPELLFPNEKQAVGIGTNFLAFYSAADRTAVTENRFPAGVQEIRQVFSDGETLAIVGRVENSEKLMIDLYKMDGDWIASLDQDQEWPNYCFNGDCIMMYSEHAVQMISKYGRERLNLNFENEIGSLVPDGDGETCYLTTMGELQKIVFR